MPGTAVLERTTREAPEAAFRRLKGLLERERASRIEEAASPIRLRATQGVGAYRLAFDIGIEQDPSGSRVRMQVTSPSDWEAHLRHRRRQIAGALVAMTGGAGLLAVALVFASSSSRTAIAVVGFLVFDVGVLAAVSAGAQYRQAKRFARAPAADPTEGGD